MSDHTRAFVPIEAWAYSSPDVLVGGSHVDIGLLAEALVYYDGVYLNVATQPQFAAVISWFKDQGGLDDLLSLFKDNSITIYDHAFISTAVKKAQEGTYILANIQDPTQARPNSFIQRYLHHRTFKAVIGSARKRDRIERLLRDRVIEVKADQYGSTIKNADADTTNPKRMSLIMQALVDSLYPLRGLGEPPTIEANVVASSDSAEHTITWNINLDELADQVGTELGVHRATPLIAAVYANRFLWSAAGLDCDLYLGDPLSRLAGDKLYESNQYLQKPRVVIETLKEEVEFPDIRGLVNSGHLGLRDVLRIRKAAKQFRRWLQTEGDRDRTALIAYHNEVARKTGLTKYGPKALRIFGALGPVVGGHVGTIVGSTETGTAIGTAASGYLWELAAKLGKDWRPVIFGNWLSDEIEKLVQQDKKKS